MGIMDSFRLRNALIQHRKGNIEEARAVYEEMYRKGVVSAQYMISWSYILLREGGELSESQGNTCQSSEST